jgi:outer membrane protein assembly factor BamB
MPGRLLALGVAFALAVGAVTAFALVREEDERGEVSSGNGGGRSRRSTSSSTTTTTAPPPEEFVNPDSVGKPYGDTVEGLLTFRGNPTRTYYGKGPVPTDPEILWQHPPEGAMCSESDDGSGVMVWCGTGWTGQPAVFEREGRTWVVFGAYDRAVHFVDAETGNRILPDFPTGDIIKGSVTIDPDGYPLVYTGSRDDYYRVIAIDQPVPTELWALHADDVAPVYWNDDWDGSGLILDDYLFEGGENSQFHIAKLNRGYGPGGEVTVAPELVFNTPGWDDQLISEYGSTQFSIENSVAMYGNTAYFSNSAGLVQGWDVSGLRTGAGSPVRTFRYWTGDDTDASVVIDEEGMLYVASEYEKHNARSNEAGQIMKLDPASPDNPVVWSIPDQGGGVQGVWATAGLHDDLVIVPTNSGRILGIDRDSGDIRWEKNLPAPTWSSPVIVDDVWIQGDCDGVLHAFDVSDTMVDPPELWSVEIGGCIESTPALYDGRIFVGTRDGLFTALGDA